MTIVAQNQIVNQFITDISVKYGISETLVLLALVIIIVWATVWKLLGLWKSARKGSWIWFIIIAITNTVGILPIIYIYVLSETKFKLKKKPTKKKRK